MARNITLIAFPVENIDTAKKVYNTFFGVEPYADSPYYVGYKVGDIEVGLVPNTKVGPITYVDVDDITSSVKEMVAAGAEVIVDVKEVAKGLFIAQLKDAEGNILGLRHQA